MILIVAGTFIVFHMAGVKRTSSRTQVKMLNSGQDNQIIFLEWHNLKDRLLFEKYNVKHTPTFMVLKDGQPQLLNKKMYSYTGINHKNIE